MANIVAFNNEIVIYFAFIIASIICLLMLIVRYGTPDFSLVKKDSLKKIIGVSLPFC